MRFARDAADRVVFMADGEILEQGTPAELFGNPQHRPHAGVRRGSCRGDAASSASATPSSIPELIARYWPDILSGIAVTLQIAVAVVITGLAVGLALALSSAATARAVANAPIIVFVDVFRALPPLVAILIVYFGLPNLGINISGFAVLWLVAVAGAGRVRRGDLLVGHRLGAERASGTRRAPPASTTGRH